MRSMPRNAWVIQITPVRLIRTTANDASVVRKIYLSIDPITPARPTSRPNARPATTRFPGSQGLRRAHPAGLLSHYHPFDPSTKWPRKGAPCHKVNNSLDVACLPRWRLAASQPTGHSVEHAPE